MVAADTEDRADTALRAIERGRSSAGDAIGRDPALARRVLEENLPQDLAAVSVLVAAVRDGVPDRLAEDLPRQSADAVLARLADSLTTRESLAPERARWAVAVWAVALGLAKAAPRSATPASPTRAPAPVRHDPAPPTTRVPPPPRGGGPAPKGARRPRYLLPLIIAGCVVVALIVVGGGVMLLRPTVAAAPVAKPVRPATTATPTPTPTPLPPILVAAHRGGDEIYPLETAQAMLDAAKRPGVAVETDMRFTADGVPVLVHDATLDPKMPCTGLTSPPKVAEKTYAWLTANCRTLASASLSGGQYTIPKVDDVAGQLAAVPGAQWLLEIKTVLTPTQETLLFDLLEKRHMVDRTVLTSFFGTELAKAGAEAKRRGDKIRLMQFVQDTSLSAQTAAQNGLWAVGVETTVLTKSYVSALHGVGLRVIVWTPDTTDEWQRAQAAGADLVITDKPIAWTTWHAAH